MRSLHIVAVACVLSFSSVSRAEVPAQETESAPPRAERINRISVAPLGVGWGVLGVEYEHAQSKLISAGVGAQVFYPALNVLTGTTRLGVGATLDVRIHPFSDERLDGFWFGPQGQVTVGSVMAHGKQYDGTDFGGRLMLGYTWVGESGFSISGGAGGGLTTSFAGIVPTVGLHLNIGYAF